MVINIIVIIILTSIIIKKNTIHITIDIITTNMIIIKRKERITTKEKIDTMIAMKEIINTLKKDTLKEKQEQVPVKDIDNFKKTLFMSVFFITYILYYSSGCSASRLCLDAVYNCLACLLHT